MHFSFEPDEEYRLTGVSVQGFKGALKPLGIKIKGLTLLAGPNSSGKTSVMQPLLLLKQTLDAVTDPGPLAIDGPNVFFTSASTQMFSSMRDGERANECRFSFILNARLTTTCTYALVEERLRLVSMEFKEGHGKTVYLREGMTGDEILAALPRELSRSYQKAMTNDVRSAETVGLFIERRRCFLYLQLGLLRSRPSLGLRLRSSFWLPTDALATSIINCIHVPAFRVLSERLYPWTETGATYPGEFDDYAGSILASWQQGNPGKIKDLSRDLTFLGLAAGVKAERINDVSVEISVYPYANRHLRRKSREQVSFSLADVGFGVSQILSVLVALRVAEPQHVVYIEEPESHLHPQAQYKLGLLIAEAAERGVRVIIETHSSLILMAIQQRIARGFLNADDVSLNWFSSTRNGSSTRAAILDADGSYGDWPVDFDEVSGNAQDAYLESAAAFEARSVE